jgi:hypothetical protein
MAGCAQLPRFVHDEKRYRRSDRIADAGQESDQRIEAKANVCSGNENVLIVFFAIAGPFLFKRSIHASFPIRSPWR